MQNKDACIDCYSCCNCRRCKGCFSCEYCADLVDCMDCFASNRLCGARYVFFNKQLTVEQYRAAVDGMKGVSVC
jgi:hypothetical protein